MNWYNKVGPNIVFFLPEANSEREQQSDRSATLLLVLVSKSRTN